MVSGYWLSLYRLTLFSLHHIHSVCYFRATPTAQLFSNREVGTGLRPLPRGRIAKHSRPSTVVTLRDGRTSSLQMPISRFQGLGSFCASQFRPTEAHQWINSNGIAYFAIPSLPYHTCHNQEKFRKNQILQHSQTHRSILHSRKIIMFIQ